MKLNTLPASNKPDATQVMRRNLPPYCADTLDPLPWALMSATNSKSMTVVIIEAMLTLSVPS